MFKTLSFGIGVALAVCAPMLTALAEPEPKQIGAFNGWTAFAYTEGKEQVCYVLGRPKTSEPKTARRDEIYLTVTHRRMAKVRAEVALHLGYALKEKSTVDAAVGPTKFALFVREDSAWAPDAKTDKALADAMAGGRSLEVKGVSARGTATTDIYELQGFAQALKAIDAACPP